VGGEGGTTMRVTSADPLPAELLRRARAAALVAAGVAAAPVPLAEWDGSTPLSMVLERDALQRVRAVVNVALDEVYGLRGELESRSAAASPALVPIVMSLHDGIVGALHATLGQVDAQWLRLLHDGDAPLYHPAAAADSGSDEAQ